MNGAFEKNVMKELKSLRGEIDYIKEFLEDTHLTPAEKKFVDSKIKKIKSGDTSDIVPWKDAKKNFTRMV